MRLTLPTFRYTRLTGESLQKLLDRKWRVVDDRLVKKYALPSHTAAADFVFQVAKAADKMGHHPQTFIKYRFVSFYLRTNDVSAITETDAKLAFISDEIKRAVSARYQSEHTNERTNERTSEASE